MSKRILSFLLAFVMVFSLVPVTAIPTFATETNAQVNAYEAYVAENVTIDGSLTETSWLTGGKLSGGQAFDILWDGGNLYFAVVAGENDTALTVKVGEKTILTAEKAEGAAAIEAKVAYNTKDYTKISNLTLTVGESTWTGNVTLAKYARLEHMTAERMGSRSGATATSDGSGLRFNMPAATKAPGATEYTERQYAMNKTAITSYSEVTGDLSLEFDFQADVMPIPTHDNAVSAGVATYVGPSITVNGSNNGFVFGFVKLSTGWQLNHNHVLIKDSKATYETTKIKLDNVQEDSFHVKAVLQKDDTVVYYVNGVEVGKIANGASPVASMQAASIYAANTLVMNAYRYGYNGKTTDGFYRYVDMDFTIKNIVFGEPVEVQYVEEDLQVAEGTYDAFVAQDITVDGNLSEVAWRAVDKLGAGQPFDILWDGGNLYFGVVASEGDETMLVKVGNEVIADVEKSGNGFEAKVPFNTNGVATLEDVTIKVGNSVWTGDVDLIKMARVEDVTVGNLTEKGAQVAANASAASVTATADGKGIVFDLPAVAAANQKVDTLYAYKRTTTGLVGRATDVSFEFTLDPVAFTNVSDRKGTVGDDNAVWAGLEVILHDDANQGIRFGIGRDGDNGLFLNCVNKATVKGTLYLGKTAGDEPFEIKVLWKTDKSIEVFVDGVSVGTVAGAEAALENLSKNYKGTNNVVHIRATRYDYQYNYYKEDVKFVVSDIKLAKAVKVVYEGAAPEAIAYVAPNAAVLDGDLSDVLWSVPNALAATSGTDVSGYSYMAWGKGYLYVAADYTGATSMELTLGEKTWTIDLTAADIATADGIVTGKNVNGVAELKIDMLKAGVEVLDFDQKAQFQLKLIGETGSAALANGYAELIFSEYETSRFDVPAASKTNDNIDSHTKIDVRTAELKHNLRQYLLLGTKLINHAYDIYYEQTLTINALPGATGAVNSVHNASGLSISIMHTKEAGTAVVVYPGENDSLLMNIPTANGVIEKVSLGKKLGDTFHFGYLWKTDDSIILFVDGKKIAEVENATYAINWAGGYYCSNVSGTTGHDVVIKDAAHTVFIDKSVPTSTTAGVLNNATTVSANLPTRYVNGHFAYNVTWATSNNKVIAANGTVTRPILEDAKVTVAAIVGGQTLEEVEVTVLADLPAEMIDGEINAVFTNAEPTVGLKGWESVPKDILVTAKNTVSAMIYNQKVYVRVDAEGEVSVTLGGETKTATSEGAVVLAFEDTTISQYGQEIALSVSLDGTAVWEENVKLVASQITVASGITLEAGKAVIKGYNTTTNANDNSFTMISDAGHLMYDNSNCAYWIYNNADLARTYSVEKDVLLEQTIRIDKMPIGDLTGHFNGAVNQAWGYLTMFEIPVNASATTRDYFSFVVYPDAEGNLYLRAMNSEMEETDAIALGKKLTEEFKLGTKCSIDGTMTVYVDDVEIAYIANVRITTTAVYKSAIMIKYMDPVVKTEGNEDASMVTKNVTVTKIGTAELCDLADEITKEVMFGSIDLENVTMDLPLPTTFRSAFLGDHALTWTTTNAAVVETDGTIHLDPEVDGTATLSVYLDGAETALWSVDVTVPATIITLNALLSEQEIVTDGALSEVAWLDWQEFGSRLPGNIAAAWTKGYLHLGVYSAEADTLKLTINGKEITVDLKNATVTGAEGAKAAKSAKNGTVEISIPLSAIGFNHTDYNQSMSFAAKLAKGETESEAQATLLNLSGDVAEIQSLSSYTKSSGPWTLLGDTVTYKGTAPGLPDYIFKTDNDYLDHKQLIVISNDFIFEALPITTGAMIKSAAQADGFYYYFSDEDPATRVGTTICASIFTEDGTNLKLRIGQGQGAEGYVFDLGATVGEQFRVTYYWYPNNTLDIYVNGALIGTVSNAGYTTSYLGIDVLTYRYYSEKATSDKVRFTITNQTIINTKYESVLDELTQNAVFGRVDLEHVQKDLNMVTSFASANFAALNLKWTSSDESVVATDGTVTRHETEAKSSKITVYFVDDEGNEIKLWDVDVTVDPMTVTKQEAPAIIHTAFAAPGSINVDGVVTDTETWLLNGWVLNAEKQAVGYFGAQWDQEYLYILLDTDAEEVSLTLGGKEIAVTKTGNITELKIPVSEILGYAKIEEYGVGMTITVTMDSSTYTGALKLSNVDWWASDNVYAGLPMLANNVKSVKMGTADQPDENQGAKQLENGWRVYDIYGGEGAANPAGIRTYILFMKLPIYEGFADRTEATQIEFDFYAKALPEWDWKEAIENDIGRAFANYGVTFSLSDKADSAKNSNVAVFGIVNTTEGLMMVVNRGNADYEAFKLNKEVGEEFRIGMTWLTNANLVLTIDGVEITTIKDMSKFVNSVGDTSFVVNMLRNKEKPTSHDDDMDVYLTNIAFGKAHSSENIIRNLTFADICGLNESENEIENDLILPTFMTNGQLDTQYPITWTSSYEDVVDPATGKVTRPDAGVKVVTLTATLEYADGTTETKEFTLIVLGEAVSNGNALVVNDDTNPFGKAATEYNGLLFNLDKNNNSIVYAIPENEEVEKINLVILTDLDPYARINRESLRLFVSDDNVTYTEIEDYKLHHDGCDWYLYDFEAEARYIKVHYTHSDKDASDFINTPGEMIHVYWNESLVVPEDAAEIAAPATTLRDQAVAITLPEGIEAEGLRVALNGEILFHYVDEDGTVYVRIADPTSGKLQLWNAEDVELADKENVYEVTYGTRETLPSSGRWVLSVKAGRTYPDGSSVDVDTLYHMSGKTVSASTDGGYTWTRVGSINFATGLSSGGWGIDSETGRMFHEFYDSKPTFVNADVSASNCVTYVFYSDDGGKTWTQASGLGKIEGDINSTYVLSYTDITELAGNDGEGPNVDFVFPMGAQFNNNGAFCGRVAYTKDGGKTWSYSESKITYGNETAFEGGVSEATILEREDGTLVYYARCQSNTVDNFTISYSLDHGVTWLTPGETSSVYTTNTQALMMTYDFGGFDGNRLTGSPIFMWGGNNVLGGSSYMRMPLNFAVSTNEMDTFRNIQNIFSETYMDTFTFIADHYITNPSIQQIHDDNMFISFSVLREDRSIYMVVNNFTDWFVRTKGGYDSFEGGTPASESWILAKGNAESTNAKASEGNFSMVVSENTQITRSVPYLQNGVLSIDLYVDASSNFVFELQPAFATNVMKCAVISAQFNGTTATLHDGTVLNLRAGWNTLTFDLELTENEASVSVNGLEPKTIVVNEQFNGPTPHELGNYITYATILATSTVYVDEFFVESTLDAVVEATEADKAAANAVIEQIKALDETSLVAEVDAVKAAFEALTQVQKDLVNRRVPTGTSTNANDEGALINYYDVLFAMEGVSEDPEVEVNTEEKPSADVTVTLPDNIELDTTEINNAANSEDTITSLGAAINDAHIEAEAITKEQAKEILGDDYQEDVEVKVEIRPYIAIEYKEVVEQGNTAALSVDIAAMIDSVVVQGEKEVTSDSKPLDTVGTDIVLNVVVPEDFIKPGQSVFVKHTKDDGTEYTYPATYDAATNTVIFINPNGFSDFVIYTVDPDVVLDSYTLTLKDYVGINFYLLLSDEAAQDENAYMQFTVGNRTIQVTERRVVVSNGVTYYVYTCPTFAKEMTTEVKGQFFFGEENEKASDVYTYSVRRYADYVLTHNYEESVKQLVRDMLQYGAMAQLQFNYNVDNLANAGIDGASDIAQVTKEMMNVAGAESDLTYDISLSLKENVTMKFYFKAEGTKDTIQVTYKGQNLTVGDDNCAEGEFCVSVTGIAAKNLGDLVELKITDGNGQTHTIKDIPLRYGYIVLNNGQMGETLENLVRSIYLYNQSAKAYFG